jgi:hypothetical protein
LLPQGEVLEGELVVAAVQEGEEPERVLKLPMLLRRRKIGSGTLAEGKHCRHPRGPLPPTAKE